MILKWCIAYLEKEIYTTVVPKVDDDKLLKFYAVLWDLPFFKNYIVDRETRFVYALANEKDPEKRATIDGQRFENSALFSKAQHAAEVLKKRSSLPQGAKDSKGSQGKR